MIRTTKNILGKPSNRTDAPRSDAMGHPADGFLMTNLRHIGVWPLARTTFALAGAMLLAVVAGENSARAGCGDYVFVRDASGRLVRASTLMANHGGQHPNGALCTGPGCPDYQAELAREPQPDSPPPPCHGPNCSGRSQLPAVPVPPAPQRTSQESTVLLLESAGSDRPAASFEFAATNHDRELHFPRSIFHPPRQRLLFAARS